MNRPPKALVSPFQAAYVGAPVTGFSGIIPYQHKIPAVSRLVPKGK